MTCFTVVESPIGALLLGGSADALERLHFMPSRLGADWVECAEEFRAAAAQLKAYFAGELRDFDLPLAPAGTPFQLAAWRELRKIPYGETISYGEQARRLGDPGAARAVGLANGANPLAIVVPCHRVIGAGGKLVGFGGGIDVKRRLLALERGERSLEFVTEARVLSSK